MKALALAALFAIVVAPAPSPAQEFGFDHGRVRYADAGVTLQRASETGAEEATPNMPFFPGDRVWADGAGRAEFQFKGGSVVRLDSRSKLDYLSHDQEGSDETIALRLWSGSLILHVTSDRSGPRFEIEAPGGLLSVSDRGVYRVDADAGETRVSVYEGQAVLDASRRRLTLEEGESVSVRRGELVEEPRRFDRAALDDFALWDRERGDLAQDRDVRSARYLPAEVAPYAQEFDAYGNWHYETEVGNVWSPRVEAGWQPYTDGRWAWTAYGWTWVPYEPWGWAVSHYGRWGFSMGLGWYWVPGRVWGPGWVSWAHGGDYVGWCPLGYRDRAVVGLGYGGYQGSGRAGSHGPGWNFAHRGDLSSRDFARRRVDAGVVERAGIRVVEQARARPTRDLRSFETASPALLTARERGVAREGRRTEPSAALTWPATTRRGNEESSASPKGRGRETPLRETARPRSEPEGTRWDWAEGSGGTSSRRTAPLTRPMPTDSGASRGRGDDPERRSPGAPRSETAPRSEAAPRHREPDRDGMDRLFQPLTEPRSAAPRGESARPRTERPSSSTGSSRPERSRPESSAPRTSNPPQKESRPPAQAPTRGDGAERRKPPRDH